MDLLDDLRNIVGKYPLIFFPYVKYVNKLPDYVVTPKTALVIEGFPRSANTFSYVAFKNSQVEEVHIGHHLHAPSAVIQAVRWKIPSVVLLRKPEDAIISLTIRDNRYSLHQGLKKYYHFYTPLWPYREKFVIAPFEQVVSDFGLVIQRVNHKYNKNFGVFVHNHENESKAFREIEQLDVKSLQAVKKGRKQISEASVARPSSTRELEKEKYQNEFEKLKNKKVYLRANHIYTKFRNYYQNEYEKISLSK